jgi:hypothetical protein
MILKTNHVLLSYLVTTRPSGDPEHVRHVRNIPCECDRSYISKASRFFAVVSKKNFKHKLTTKKKKRKEKHLCDGHCMY